MLCIAVFKSDVDQQEEFTHATLQKFIIFLTIKSGCIYNVKLPEIWLWAYIVLLCLFCITGYCAAQFIPELSGTLIYCICCRFSSHEFKTVQVHSCPAVLHLNKAFGRILNIILSLCYPATTCVELYQRGSSRN